MDNESELARQIVIPVEVPEVQVVHTAELRLSTLSDNTDETTHAAVGHGIPAELILQHTRRWCSQRSETQEPVGELEFAYELHVNQDLWLIGGRRRGHFTAVEGEIKKFAIMLLPQKAGYLLLPSIEIKTFVVTSSSGNVVGANTSTPTTFSMQSIVGQTINDTTSTITSPTSATPTPTTTTTTMTVPLGPWTQQQRRQIVNEVDYKNHGEVILVLPNLRKTTVSLESGSPGLIESESRVIG